MTLSFHNVPTYLWEDINTFPKRDARDLYSLNAPLKDGLSDASLRNLFGPVVSKAMEVYQPDVVVLQCGADSLAGDLSATFNLKIKGHGDCLQFIRSFNVPLLVLGGGGFNPIYVPHCWCYEVSFISLVTSIMLFVYIYIYVSAAFLYSCCLVLQTAIAVGLGEEFEKRLNVNEFPFRPNLMPDLNTRADIGTLR